MHKQLDAALDRLDRRAIVGTWETRAAWEAWHLEPAFFEARAQLDDLEVGKPEQWWHAVILDVRPV